MHNPDASSTAHAADSKEKPGSQSSPAAASRPKRVMVGMSGGVDSSVSAYLLLEAGYQVEGLFMKNWDEDDGSEYCTAKDDLADAEQVAEKLGILLHTANFAAEYWDNVFEHFIHEYKSGRTPNPDILCNKEIKFKAFLDYAKVLGADCIATGHYARLKHAPANQPSNPASSTEQTVQLLKGLDNNKDQSYFLHAVSAEQLTDALFPLGEIEKPRVREIAQQQGFLNHNKKDSTGICFIGERKFKDFLQRYIPAQPGEIITDTGQALGEHQGLMYYTIGQRQGIGVGGVKESSEAPWYVLQKQLETNQLVVGQGHDHPLLQSTRLFCSEIHWINTPNQWPLRCMAKTRYRQPDQSCTIEKTELGYQVTFDSPQRAVTPGQSLVLYQGEVCLGGGVIEKTL